jgi:hypothetical protein
MLLPANRRHVVYEQHTSAVYYPSRVAEVAPEASLSMPYLHTCRERKFPVHAWTVICHNDRLGALAPIENVFGDRYTHALCPANPETRRYAAALCAEIAALPGIAAIDLEAAGYMGYEHGGLHDKRGLVLPPEIVFLLSICMCPHCRDLLGEVAEQIRSEAADAVRHYLQEGVLAPPPPHPALLAARRTAQIELLAAIRNASAGTPVNVRLATDPLFTGGKSTLAWSDLPGLVDAATVTFFGVPAESVAAELRRIPPPAGRPVPVWGGFVFHGPDCASEAAVEQRLAALESAQLDGVAFYTFSLAAPIHFEWLRRALRRRTFPST